MSRNFEMEIGQIIQSLKTKGQEGEVESKLIPVLIDYLGFKKGEFESKPPIQNVGKPDFVCSINGLPFLIIEAKAYTTSFEAISKNYIGYKQQVAKYLESIEMKEAPYGLLINGKQAQVFQRKENMIFPKTPILDLGTDPKKGYSELKKLIGKPKKDSESQKTFFIIAVYNNKGGVGKTVTTGNIAGTLSNLGKRVLIVDLDPQQRDLSDSFKLSTKDQGTSIFDVLLGKPEKNSSLKATKINENLYLIKGDSKFDSVKNASKNPTLQISNKFRKILEKFASKFLFDYVIIDCPTNWSFFSKTGVSVADGLLIPVNYQAAQSIHNAVQVLDTFVPEVWKEMKGARPEVLPILYNNAYTEQGSRDFFSRVLKHEINKLTKDRWYEGLFDSKLEISHYQKIAASLFLHLEDRGPSPYVLSVKGQSEISKAYREITRSLLKLWE